jgi:NOL1/NOP2/fmu family ribosome biogenesis protein
LLQRKRGEAASPKRPFPIQLSEPMRRLAGDFFQDLLSDSLPTGNLTVKGHYLYLIPEGLPELDHLKVIHPGWWLGELHKNRIEPSHAMALGLRPNQTRRRIEVSINDLRVPAYLHGEALRIEGTPGWNLFTIQTDPAGSIFALGWGKHSQGVLKNAYPRGLRWM